MVLTETIDKLAAFEPVPFPVLSLYLNAQPDSVGRDRYGVFLRKTFPERLRTYPAHSPERESLARDIDRIEAYLSESVRPSANGIAIFACSGADNYFEALQLDAPIHNHELLIGDRPHLYPLARLDDQFPRYAVVLADTKETRIFVLGLNRVERHERVTGRNTRRVKSGGWSQARLQRRVDDQHLHHAKDVAESLERIVRNEAIPHVILAGDDVVLPLVRAQLPARVEERLVDVLHLDAGTAERELLEASIESLRRKDAETDAELIEQLLGEVRRGGLGVIGAENTLAALERGQVETLLIAARSDVLANIDGVAAAIESAHEAASATASRGVTPAGEAVPAGDRVANYLVTLARRTSADVRFIEDPLLLADVGGVGALLRFRL
jgi:peptide chain release factor subunit 1